MLTPRHQTASRILPTDSNRGQMRGYGRMFVLGAGVFTLASLGCGLAQDATLLIAARAVQGVGGAFMVAQVLSGIQLNYSGQERVRAIGAYAMALSAAAVIGQILGGVLIAANLFGAAWRPAFLVNVPIGGLLILAAVRVLPTQHAATHLAPTASSDLFTTPIPRSAPPCASQANARRVASRSSNVNDQGSN